MENSKKVIREIADFCMSKPGTYESRPFGEYPVCYRVMGKIFAQLNPQENFYKITLKCNPDQAYIYRELYTGVVVRGYHCPPVQQPYWNTVDLYEFSDMNMLKQMIEEAYMETVNKLTKKARLQLTELSRLTYIQTDEVSLAVYKGRELIGRGAFHICDEEHAELDVIDIEPDFQSIDLDAEIARRLEAMAIIQGYHV